MSDLLVEKEVMTAGDYVIISVLVTFTIFVEGGIAHMMGWLKAFAPLVCQ